MSLERAWKHRNTLAEALDQALDDLAARVRAVSDDALVAFIVGFAPGRAPDPEWSASLERFVDVLWEVVPGRVPALHAVYAARPPLQWGAVANLLGPEAGERFRTRSWKPPHARRRAVILR